MCEFAAGDETNIFRDSDDGPRAVFARFKIVRQGDDVDNFADGENGKFRYWKSDQGTGEADLQDQPMKAPRTFNEIRASGSDIHLSWKAR